MTTNVTLVNRPRGRYNGHAAQCWDLATITVSRGGCVEPADSVLVESCLAGDQQAYAVLLDRYRDRAFWTAYKFVNKQEDAADVVQEAFIKAFAMLERFDRDRAFFTWLYRIVVNVAIDHIRKRDARPAVALEDVGDYLPDAAIDDPLESASRNETQADVHRVLALLPDTYREVLTLSEIDGLSCKEIGEMLDIPHATARWRLHHARKIFKDIWERRVLKIQPADAADSDG